MVSVTQRLSKVKQPRGGYIKPKDFNTIELNDGIDLYEEENIHSTLIGLAVDYLARFTMGTSLEKAFKISLRGALRVNESDYAEELLNGISGLDDTSIENACKLVGFDTAFRAGIASYKPVHTIQPDFFTSSNIRTMVERSRGFNDNYGPIVKDGFTFEGGYTELISSGDGDFLTETTLWDFKVSKKDPTNKNTLQLLIYYLMGVHSIHSEFKQIENLGIFNPRLNKVYLLPISTISSEIINEVNTTVIGY
ncbi:MULTISPECIES: hypothetical protein [unclassified Bacillus cereus group]|uniref:hypothetical protein n=1 Tax=unclassified Bacillus cereus group TaxID=2750818 RepID=UPI0008A823C2|nr:MULTISPECIES: hypothetical protein [unclassified Bacillus cereus group]AOY18380.1 hypothetical protein BGI23_24795 [Bacillus sp. ABP14]